MRNKEYYIISDKFNKENNNLNKEDPYGYNLSSERINDWTEEFQKRFERIFDQSNFPYVIGGIHGPYADISPKEIKHGMEPLYHNRHLPPLRASDVFLRGAPTERYRSIKERLQPSPAEIESVEAEYWKAGFSSWGALSLAILKPERRFSVGESEQEAIKEELKAGGMSRYETLINLKLLFPRIDFNTHKTLLHGEQPLINEQTALDEFKKTRYLEAEKLNSTTLLFIKLYYPGDYWQMHTDEAFDRIDTFKILAEADGSNPYPKTPTLAQNLEHIARIRLLDSTYKPTQGSNALDFIPSWEAFNKIPEHYKYGPSGLYLGRVAAALAIITADEVELTDKGLIIDGRNISQQTAHSESIAIKPDYQKAVDRLEVSGIRVRNVFGPTETSGSLVIPRENEEVKPEVIDLKPEQPYNDRFVFDPREYIRQPAWSDARKKVGESIGGDLSNLAYKFLLSKFVFPDELEQMDFSLSDTSANGKSDWQRYKELIKEFLNGDKALQEARFLAYLQKFHEDRFRELKIGSPVFEKMKDEFKNASMLNNPYREMDYLMNIALDLRFLFSGRFSELNIENLFTEMKGKLREDRKRKDWHEFMEHASIIRILMPHRFNELGITKDDWVNQLETLNKDKGTPDFICDVTHLAILGAENSFITQTFGNNSDKSTIHGFHKTRSY